MRMFLFVTLLLLSFPGLVQAKRPFDSGHAGFSVQVKGIENVYRVMGIYVLPNEIINLKASSPFAIESSTGKLGKRNDSHWTWIAPIEKGLNPLKLRTITGKVMIFNVFVMRPAMDVKNGKLDDYRIGSYPSKLYKGLAIYKPPEGFIEVTSENMGTLISPHFTLGQFLCKQMSTGAKKFLVLRTALLLKLEKILQEANREGYHTDSFFIMSGYRTPFYNKAIGNVQYSRHIYGGAADFYIDVSPKDGSMDDLNQDEKVDRQDAVLLYKMIERISKRENWNHVGGMGVYGKTHTHGPFVHIDSRGIRARWGKP